MARQKMVDARELIKQKRYDEARAILKTVDHPTAREWLAKIDQIAPTKSAVGDERDYLRGLLAEDEPRPRKGAGAAPAKSKAKAQSSSRGMSDTLFYALAGLLVIVIVVVVAVAVMGGGGNGGGGGSDLSQTFSGAGISVNYPANWTAVTQDTAVVLASSADLANIVNMDNPLGADLSGLPDVGHIVAIQTDQLPTPSAHDALQQIHDVMTQFSALGGAQPEFEIGDIEDLNVGGHSAAGMRITAQGGAIHFVVVELGNSRGAIAVSISSDGSGEDLFMDILGSATFA